jgi:hypothetical protein
MRVVTALPNIQKTATLAHPHIHANRRFLRNALTAHVTNPRNAIPIGLNSHPTILLILYIDNLHALH